MPQNDEMDDVPEEPELAEDRVGYQGEVPVKKSVFEYRDKKRRESWFDWSLWALGLFYWYYDININEPIDSQL